MSKQIKIGNAVFDVPEESSSSITSTGQEKPVQNVKPDTPEPLEEKPYIYRPNDPFQASVDEARAIASISTSHKPWVRKTWFVLFVIGPLVYVELMALAANRDLEGWEWGKSLAFANTIFLPVWLIYFSISKRRVKKA